MPANPKFSRLHDAPEYEEEVFEGILKRRKHLQTMGFKIAEIEAKIQQNKSELAHLILDRHPTVFEACLAGLCHSQLCVDAESFLKITFLLAGKDGNYHYEKTDVFLRALRVCPDEASKQIDYYESSLSLLDFKEVVKFIRIEKDSVYFQSCLRRIKDGIRISRQMGISPEYQFKRDLGTLLPSKKVVLPDNLGLVRMLRDAIISMHEESHSEK